MNIRLLVEGRILDELVFDDVYIVDDPAVDVLRMIVLVKVTVLPPEAMRVLEKARLDDRGLVLELTVENVESPGEEFEVLLVTVIPVPLLEGAMVTLLDAAGVEVEEDTATVVLLKNTLKEEVLGVTLTPGLGAVDIAVLTEGFALL